MNNSDGYQTMGNTLLTCRKVLEIILKDNVEINSISESTIKNSCEDALFKLLPLIMMCVERVGHNCKLEDRPTLSKLLQAFRDKISTRRWIKLRFMLLCGLPCFKSFWGLDPVFKENAYAPECLEKEFEYESDEEESESRGVSGCVKRVEFRLPVDVIDLQSVEFWSHTIHKKKRNSENIDSDFEFPITSVTHPLYPISLGHENDTSKDDNLSSVVQSVLVRKVFSSIARPKLVQLRKIRTGAQLDESDAYETINPALMVKTGDNLMNDYGVMTMFRCFNIVWEEDEELATKYGSCPHAFSFEILPTSASQGMLQGLDNLTSLADFPWNEWSKNNKDNIDVIDKMVRTAAGSFIATYIMGVRDRHFDNILIQGEDTMFHIDFSYILGEKPPVDGPPISLSPGMESGLRSVGAWEKFVDFSVDAFQSLRKRNKELLQIGSMVFQKAGFAESEVETFLSGRKSLNLSENDETAKAIVRVKIEESSEHLGNWFKDFTHENVVPVWFKLLKEGFPPATVAMEAYNELIRRREDQIAENEVKIDENNSLLVE